MKPFEHHAAHRRYMRVTANALLVNPLSYSVVVLYTRNKLQSIKRTAYRAKVRNTVFTLHLSLDATYVISKVSCRSYQDLC